MSEGPVRLKGIGASPGFAVGRAFPIDRRRLKTPKYHVDDAVGGVARELARLKASIAQSDKQLADIKGRLGAGDQEHALIIEAHRLMLNDELLLGEAEKQIQEDHVNAEWAVRRAVKSIKASFEAMDDVYFRERRSDVDFVGDRIIRNLMGEVTDVQELPPEDAVIVAHDLSPADAALLLSGRRVAGFVTDVGGKTSHTAIVARALDIPAVVGTERASELVGRYDPIALDGEGGLVILNPSADDLREFLSARTRYQDREKVLLESKELPAETRDGARLELHANIEFNEEIPSALSHGASGVGLYRTEFLYMNRPDLPSEDEQCAAYQTMLERLAPRPVTMRTFDLGGDNIAISKPPPREINPALGLRAIRFSLRYPEIFKTQLRALLRAAPHGNLRIMFPMIGGTTELRAAKKILAEAREELTAEGLTIPPVPVGIMVEMPSTALIADRLAPHVDFLSLGTNDLIQYSLAIDRQNREVAYLYRPLHLAVLRQIKGVAEAAKAAKIPVAMCGEMAGDPLFTLVLLGLGLGELSMHAVYIPVVKRIVRECTLAEARQLVERVMNLVDDEEIENAVREEMTARFPDLIASPGLGAE